MNILEGRNAVQPEIQKRKRINCNREKERERKLSERNGGPISRERNEG